MQVNKATRDKIEFTGGGSLKVGDEVIIDKRRATVKKIGVSFVGWSDVEIYVLFEYPNGRITLRGFMHEQKCYWQGYFRFLWWMGQPWLTAKKNQTQTSLLQSTEKHGNDDG